MKKYSCHPDRSYGKIHDNNKTYPNIFDSDRNELISSNAFRRLQNKTQVFLNYPSNDYNDHWRNRITHSIEVASVARTIASHLGFSKTLSEVISLAHDLGHPPFGHSGEEALQECDNNYNFNHNNHTLKLILFLEGRNIDFSGLNLSWEAIDGIVKHNGPIDKNFLCTKVYNKLKELNINLNEHTSGEGQIAAISDDISYVCHDVEDALKIGIISFDDIMNTQLFQKALNIVFNNYKIDSNKMIYLLVDQMKEILISDVIHTSTQNIKKFNIQSSLDIRHLNETLVCFSPTITRDIAEIKAYLFKKVYDSPKLRNIRLQSKNLIKNIFRFYMENFDLMPQRADYNESTCDTKEKIFDYIAGMTDVFAIEQYQKLFCENYFVN